MFSLTSTTSPKDILKRLKQTICLHKTHKNTRRQEEENEKVESNSEYIQSNEDMQSSVCILNKRQITNNKEEQFQT